MQEQLLRPQIEVLYRPFQVDEQQRLPFRDAEIQFKQASEKINNLWRVYLDAGIDRQFMIAEVTGMPQKVRLVESDGDETTYLVHALGQTAGLTQKPLDVFRLMKSEEESDSPKENFITIGLEPAPRPRLGDLVTFDMQDEGKKIVRNKFYFYEGSLFAVHQITKPSVLYPELNGNDDEFFSLAFSKDDDEDVLKVEAGFAYDDSRGYWYKN